MAKIEQIDNDATDRLISYHEGVRQQAASNQKGQELEQAEAKVLSNAWAVAGAVTEAVLVNDQAKRAMAPIMAVLKIGNIFVDSAKAMGVFAQSVETGSNAQRTQENQKPLTITTPSGTQGP